MGLELKILGLNDLLDLRGPRSSRPHLRIECVGVGGLVSPPRFPLALSIPPPLGFLRASGQHFGIS
eukprot:5010803-Alexandrium_andersonii.AAC.1